MYTSAFYIYRWYNDVFMKERPGLKLCSDKDFFSQVLQIDIK